MTSSNQRRSSVQNRTTEGQKSVRPPEQGSALRKPSVEEEKPNREPATSSTSSKSRIKVLEECCESILKENSRASKKNSDTSKQILTCTELDKPVSSNNIVESIAACIDKYTSSSSSTSGGKNQKKDLNQRLSIKTCSTTTTAATTTTTTAGTSKTTLTSPRKRHLLEMREREQEVLRQTARSSSPPPLLLPSLAPECSSELLPPPLLEKATSAPAAVEKSKKSRHHVVVVAVDKSNKNECEPPMLSLPSPPRLSPIRCSLPELKVPFSSEKEIISSSLLITADSVGKRPEAPVQTEVKRRGRPPTKKPEMVNVEKPEIVETANVYLPRCSDISEDEIEEGKSKCDAVRSGKRVLQPPAVAAKQLESPPALEKEDARDKKSKVKDAEPSEANETKVVGRKACSKRQKTTAASKISSQTDTSKPDEASKIAATSKIAEASVDVESPKPFVPKILKSSLSTLSENLIKTQDCCVRVEKLADNFVSRSKNVRPVEDDIKSINNVNVAVTKAPATAEKIFTDEKVSTVGKLERSKSALKRESLTAKAAKKKSEQTEAEASTETASRPVEKLKKRKRKANKTGFPTAKKKKKVVPALSEPKTPKIQSRPPSSAEQHHQQPVRSSSRLQEPEEQQKQPDQQQKEQDQQQQDHQDVKVNNVTAELPLPVKGKRGRPAKHKPNSSSHSSAKRSRIYDEADDEVDCLALLPMSESSGPSSEAQSSAETDDVIGGSNDDSNLESKTRKKRKHKASSLQPPFKKNYLVAGLFSDFYKKTTSVNYPQGASESASKKSLNYNINAHVHGLLPPPYYCGRQLRQKKEDFQLPYDLWWLHAHKQLPGRDVVATWNYKRIKNNVFFDIKPVANFEGQACHCRHKSESPGCGDECINRMTYSECDPRLCPLGDRCTNNQIQKHRGVTGLERFMTEEKGWGVRSKVRITGGEFVMEYVGEVVSEKEFKLRMLTEYVDDTHHYCLHLDGGAVIDGHRMGGECRFVNHSCRPNCEMQKWTVNGLYRMALFTLRDIEPGEELTYDYNFSLFNPHEGQTCRCGASDCRGVIGGRSQRINGLVAKPDPKSEPKPHGSQSTSSCASSVSGVGENRGRDRKKVATVRRQEGSTPTRALQLLAQVKPMSHQQRCFAQEHRCFLLRNFEKVRRVREKIQRKVAGANFGVALREESTIVPTATMRSEQMILTGLTALTTARSMQTRRLAIAQDDPNVTKVVKLAQIIREIFAQVTSINGECLSYLPI